MGIYIRNDNGEFVGSVDVTYQELGIGYPVLVNSLDKNMIGVPYVFRISLPESPLAGGESGGTRTQDADVPQFKEVSRYDFVIQFSWQPTPPSQRIAKRQEQAAAASDDVASLDR